MTSSTNNKTPLTPIVNMQEAVKAMLNIHPTTRDDDKLLVAKIWWHCTKKMNIDPEKATMLDFMQLYKDGHLPSADVITRARRKVQENYPELRGNTWDERHNEAKEIAHHI